MTIEKRVLRELNKVSLSNSELRNVLGLSPFHYSRELDNALQYLRSTGQIRYEGRRWMVATRKKCAHCEGTGWMR